MDNYEIDRLVAEKIFNWDTHHYENINVISVFTEEGTLKIPDDFSPSTNIQDAWLVTEKVRETFGMFRLVQMTDYWMVDVQTNNGGFYQESDSAPLAICLAALKSVGVELDGTL